MSVDTSRIRPLIRPPAPHPACGHLLPGGEKEVARVLCSYTQTAPTDGRPPPLLPPAGEGGRRPDEGPDPECAAPETDASRFIPTHPQLAGPLTFLRRCEGHPHPLVRERWWLDAGSVMWRLFVWVRCRRLSLDD